jgi:hypothetical protein
MFTPPEKLKYGDLPTWKIPVTLTLHSLRWHYPNQVPGSKVTPSSQPVYKLPVYEIRNKNRRHLMDASCKKSL